MTMFINSFDKMLTFYNKLQSIQEANVAAINEDNDVLFVPTRNEIERKELTKIFSIDELKLAEILKKYQIDQKTIFKVLNNDEVLGICYVGMNNEEDIFLIPLPKTTMSRLLPLENWSKQVIGCNNLFVVKKLLSNNFLELPKHYSKTEDQELLRVGESKVVGNSMILTAGPSISGK